jgi:hypothetical protein
MFKCSAGGLSELCHKHVIHISKRLRIYWCYQKPDDCLYEVYDSVLKTSVGG